MQSRLTIISLLLLLCCGSSSVFGQQAQKKDANGIESWDRNKDGLLQPDEIPEKARLPLKKWAEKQGLNPDKPLPIDKLLESKTAGKGKKLEDAEKSAKKEDRKKKKKAESEANDKQPVQNARVRKVAGFGKDTESGSSKDADPKNKDDGDKELSRAERRKQQTQKMLAKSMMFQNDKNKNGRLEKNEWTKLKGNPGAADANKDGVLTLEELSNHLQGFGKRERDVTRRAPRRSTRSAKNKNGKSYRFLTPQERLPEGLPPWFTERDYDADGQISLSEYHQELTAAKVAKFKEFDLNGDGFILAKEYLKATAVE